MKRFSGFLAALAALVLFAGQVQADLIGSVTHNYGSGSYAPLGGSCDTLNANSVTVRNSSSCGRFYDAFNFSHLAYDNIDSFTLSVSFSDTAAYSLFLGFIPVNVENWRVRPASSASNGSDLDHSSVNIGRSTGLDSASFSFDSSLDVFNDILSGEAFYLWFNQSGGGAHNFNLYSASLDVYGTPTLTPSLVASVPAPGVLGLLGLGLAGIGFSRRRRKS